MGDGGGRLLQIFREIPSPYWQANVLCSSRNGEASVRNLSDTNDDSVNQPTKVYAASRSSFRS
jgi:hypothetical protein